MPNEWHTNKFIRKECMMYGETSGFNLDCFGVIDTGLRIPICTHRPARDSFAFRHAKKVTNVVTKFSKNN